MLFWHIQKLNAFVWKFWKVNIFFNTNEKYKILSCKIFLSLTIAKRRKFNLKNFKIEWWSFFDIWIVLNLKRKSLMFLNNSFEIFKLQYINYKFYNIHSWKSFQFLVSSIEPLSGLISIKECITFVAYQKFQTFQTPLIYYQPMWE